PLEEKGFPSYPIEDSSSVEEHSFREDERPMHVGSRANEAGHRDRLRARAADLPAVAGRPEAPCTRRCQRVDPHRMRRQDDLDSPFAPEADSLPEGSSTSAGPSWKIAIVDDEQEVHDVTVLALQNVSF